jgi:transcription initiation factor TFIIB
VSQSEYYTKCPECNAGLIQDYSKGEYICQKCGYVVLDQADDFGPESHSSDYDERSRNTRASGFTSISLHDYGLRTEIALSSKDYSGKSIDNQMAEQMNSMRKWHSRIRIASPKERRLSNVLSKINETCSLISLPKSIAETAAMIYRNFENRYEAKGKSIACMAAATIYLACKRCSIIRSLEEIVGASGVTEYNRSNLKLASKYYRDMVMEMGSFRENEAPETAGDSSQVATINHLESNAARNVDTTSTGSFVGSLDSYGIQKGLAACIGPDNTNSGNVQNGTLKTANRFPGGISIDHYISKLVNTSKIDTKIERLAMDIALKTYDHLLADGKAPNGLAAAYIYLAAILLGVNLLQMDVSNLAGVTEVTIRNRCKDVLTNFKITIVVKPVVKA